LEKTICDICLELKVNRDAIGSITTYDIEGHKITTDDVCLEHCTLEQAVKIVKEVKQEQVKQKTERPEDIVDSFSIEVNELQPYMQTIGIKR